MPSSLTHYIFGKTSQKEISNAFLVGTQGPDPFFYNGYTSINAKRAKTVRNFGKFLHSIDPYKTFEFISNYINEHKNDGSENDCEDNSRDDVRNGHNRFSFLVLTTFPCQ